MHILDLVTWRQLRVALLLVSLVGLISVAVMKAPKDCKEDLDCFQEKSIACKPTLAKGNVEGNIYLFKVRGQKEPQTCIVTALLTLPSPQAPVPARQALQNKGMVCEIPTELLIDYKITQVPDLITYCTGPLKEALQAITIENMYEQIVKNLSEVIKDARGGFVF